MDEVDCFIMGVGKEVLRRCRGKSMYKGVEGGG